MSDIFGRSMAEIEAAQLRVEVSRKNAKIDEMAKHIHDLHREQKRRYKMVADLEALIVVGEYGQMSVAPENVGRLVVLAHRLARMDRRAVDAPYWQKARPENRRAAQEEGEG